MPAPLAALFARAAIAVRGAVAGNAARAGAQAAAGGGRAAAFEQAKEAARYGIRQAQEASHKAQERRSQGNSGSLSDTFNQAKGALAYGWRKGDADAIEVGVGKLIELGKKISPLPVAVAAVAVGMALLPKKIADFAGAMLESRKQFGELNSSYADTYMRLNAQRHGRSIRLAGMTSGYSASLAAETNKLEERLLPYAAKAMNFLSTLVVAMEYLVQSGITVAEAMSYIEPTMGMAREFFARFSGGESVDQSALNQLSQAIANGRYGGRRFPPIDRERQRGN